MKVNNLDLVKLQFLVNKTMNIYFDLLFCRVSIIALSSYDDFQTSLLECDVWTNMFLTSTKVIFIN